MTCSAGGGASAAAAPAATASAARGCRLHEDAAFARVRVRHDGRRAPVLLASGGRPEPFDPWHPHNQFLRIRLPPLAARLAVCDAQCRGRLLLRRSTRAFCAPPTDRRSAAPSARCRRPRRLAALAALGGRDHLLLVSSARPMDELYGEALPVRDAIQLKIELGDTRRRESLRRANHVAVPYFVPAAQDDATRAADKTQSVCLAGWSPAAAAGARRSRAPSAIFRTPTCANSRRRTSGSARARRRARGGAPADAPLKFAWCQEV